MSTQVRNVDAASCAKVFAIMYAILGFVIGACFSLFFVLVALLGRRPGLPAGGGAVGLLLGVGAIIFFPVFYGAIGAIGGLIMSGLYNLVARRVGGIEIEIS
jgi:hypothetical protein